MRRLVPLIVLSIFLACGILLWKNRVADEQPDPGHSGPMSGSTKNLPPSITPRTRKLISQIAEPAATGYVGSSQCIECHADIAEKFRRHPMARSISTVADAAPLEDYVHDTSFSPDGPREYGVETVDGTVRHFEHFLDVDGNTVYRQSETIEFAVGSGQRGRSYLMNRDGLLFMSPVTWYSEGTRWDLSPGYAPAVHPRFERRVSDGCIACHAGAVRQERNGPNRFAKQPFFELSIGCERCHGPGKEHIDRQHKPYDYEQNPIRSAIINPGKLGHAARDSVCYQCHLHGVDRVPRTGHSEFSFRPGALLSDVWTVFVSGSAVGSDDDSARAVSQVEQMHESECFKRSDGKLGCISCHDPHSIPSKEMRASFFRERCLLCHKEADDCSLERPVRLQSSPEDSCIKCHMPKRDASDVPHTSQTDHRVLKRPQTSGSHPATPSGPPVQFSPKLFPVPRSEVLRAEAIIFARFSEPMASNLAREAFNRLQQIHSPDSYDVAMLNALGMTQVRIGQVDSGRHSLERAFNERPGHESVVDSLVQINERAGDLKMALTWAKRFVEANPSSSFGHSSLALLLMRLNNTQRAIKEAEISLKLNPLMNPTREALISFLQKNGMTDAAAEHQKILSRLKLAVSQPVP